jgi:hypothetical protein
MKYLPKKDDIPLHELLPYIQPYISHKIDPAIAQGIFSIMQSQQFNPQGQSQVNPGPYNPQSNVYPHYPPKQP